VISGRGSGDQTCLQGRFPSASAGKHFWAGRRARRRGPRRRPWDPGASGLLFVRPGGGRTQTLVSRRQRGGGPLRWKPSAAHPILPAGSAPRARLDKSADDLAYGRGRRDFVSAQLLRAKPPLSTNAGPFTGKGRAILVPGSKPFRAARSLSHSAARYPAKKPIQRFGARDGGKAETVPGAGLPADIFVPFESPTFAPGWPIPGLGESTGPQEKLFSFFGTRIVHDNPRRCLKTERPGRICRPKRWVRDFFRGDFGGGI